MAAATNLDFWNREILLAIGVLRVETHQHAKCHRNRSIGCEDIKIFQCFKLAAARHASWIVEFAKFYWLTVSGGPRRITIPNFEFVLYFTHLPTSPHGRICTKFGTGVVVAKFVGDRLRDFSSVGGGRKCRFLPLTKPLAVNTLLTRLRSEWCQRHYLLQQVMRLSYNFVSVYTMLVNVYFTRICRTIVKRNV